MKKREFFPAAGKFSLLPLIPPSETTFHQMEQDRANALVSSANTLVQSLTRDVVSYTRLEAPPVMLILLTS